MKTLLAVNVAGLMFATMASVQEPNRHRGGRVPTVRQLVIAGNRRIPVETIRSWIGMACGQKFSAEQIDRDVRAVYLTGHFRDVKAFADDDYHRVIFAVSEWPSISEIRYEGISPEIESVIPAEWQSQGIAVGVGSEYNPVQVKRATRAIQELLARAGYQGTTVEILVENVSSTEVALGFKAE